jgi:hypothetical protein
MIIFLVFLAVFLAPQDYRNSVPGAAPHTVKNPYCREFYNEPNPPIVTAPSYTTTGVNLGTSREYKLIKQRVQIDWSLFNNRQGHHFFDEYREQYIDPEGKKFVKRLPNGEQGESYNLPSEVSNATRLTFADFGLLYLFYTDDNFIPLDTGTIMMAGGIPKTLTTADIYKAVDMPELPEWVLKCKDEGTGGQLDQIVFKGQGLVYPKQNPSLDNKQHQLEWFAFDDTTVLLQAWWTPHCKPAVYLYPQQKQLVNVKVFPKGELGYTDPLYNSKTGWTVEAHPDGTIYDSRFKTESQAPLTIHDKPFDYLYYESKISDQVIQKPQQGWVVKQTELNQFFENTLPLLGLNEKEKTDFIEYWIKALPDSSYYFIGLMDKTQRDYLEALEVTPTPDTSIRFSFYFEPLAQPKVVKTPQIITPQRKGFTLVDWGGMIKLHPGTPFTCSQ